MWAEVGLPAGTDVTGYGIHPALLDAALHPLAAAFFGGAADADSQPDTLRLPFAFSGISLHATAATELRVRAGPPARTTFTLRCC